MWQALICHRITKTTGPLPKYHISSCKVSWRIQRRTPPSWCSICSLSAATLMGCRVLFHNDRILRGICALLCVCAGESAGVLVCSVWFNFPPEIRAMQIKLICTGGAAARRHKGCTRSPLCMIRQRARPPATLSVYSAGFCCWPNSQSVYAPRLTSQFDATWMKL